MLWCLGMHGSASTWTFNAVQKIAAVAMRDVRVVPVFVTDTMPDHDQRSGTLIVKTHATSVGQELARRATAIIVSIRDPRDVVASLMRHHKASFDLAFSVTEASAWTCAEFVPRH